MYTSSWCALALAVLPALDFVHAVPLPGASTVKTRKGGVTLPFLRHSRRVAARDGDDGDVLGGSVGLGDSADLFYSVAVTVGNSTTAVNLVAREYISSKENGWGRLLAYGFGA
ncbi:hypothetical protein C8Q79DRAFT_540228 [Trametes meyenii]|nr:hypothetical protein C8Q79DRAFT_540228 [Trametes meyenii]